MPKEEGYGVVSAFISAVRSGRGERGDSLGDGSAGDVASHKTMPSGFPPALPHAVDRRLERLNSRVADSRAKNRVGNRQRPRQTGQRLFDRRHDHDRLVVARKARRFLSKERRDLLGIQFRRS